ncbi:trimeric intracellular cation channel family protein [Myxococcaceae bacterium GXIMD 01537]
MLSREMLRLPAYIELGAVVLGSLSGAIHGVRRDADAVGVLTLAIVTGVGGGIVRDILIGHGPPVVLRTPWYLVVTCCAGLLVLFFTSWLNRFQRGFEYLDAILLGLWVVMGLERALTERMPVLVSVFLGVVTATGGGVLRDLLSGERPSLTIPGELYVTPAFISALVYVLIFIVLRMPRVVAEAATLGCACLLRVAAMRHHWTLPKTFDVVAWGRRHQRRRRRRRKP